VSAIFLCYYSESGSTHHVRNSQKDEDEEVQFVRKEALQVLQAVQGVRDHILGRCGWHLSCFCVMALIDLRKMLQCQGRRWCSVELGNLVQDFDRLGLLTLTEEELWRLVEMKDKVSNEEDSQSHETEDNHCVSPAHVAGGCAACFTVGNGATGG